MLRIDKLNRTYFILVVGLLMVVSACNLPSNLTRSVDKSVPETYSGSTDTLNSADFSWREYFQDPCLVELIDSALSRNQELNITLQELQMGQNEIMAKKGEYLPFVDIKAGGGGDKVGRYTTHGAAESAIEIAPGTETPEFVPDMMVGAFANWEIDIWRKLRNGRDAATKRYLASVEGKNFMVTNLVAEIANSYYELLALDQQMEIVQQNIEIQSNALKIVKLQKEATKVTELAVRKFEAEVFKTRSMQYEIQQKIVETENRINFLVGRFPEPVCRTSQKITDLTVHDVNTGIPIQLIENRPDIRQKELELQAAKLDVKIAKAEFYPSIGVSAGVGLDAFHPTYFFNPESMLLNLAGDLAAPVINRKAIKAGYLNANAKQMQMVFDYEQTLLNGYLEVATEVSRLNNLKKNIELKEQQVQSLKTAIKISNDLFASARADYMEILMTQRDALESRFELVETKMKEMQASVNVYRALGGGWQ